MANKPTPTATKPSGLVIAIESALPRTTMVIPPPQPPNGS
jgi:hypothetical protein